MMAILQACIAGGLFFVVLGVCMNIRYHMVVTKAKRFEKMLEDLYGGKDYVVTKDGELIEYDEDTQE